MGFEMLTVGKPGTLYEAETRQPSIMFLLMYIVGSLMWALHVSPIPGVHLSSGAGESGFWERKMPV